LHDTAPKAPASSGAFLHNHPQRETEQKVSLNEPARLRSASFGATAFALCALAGLPSRSAKREGW